MIVHPGNGNWIGTFVNALLQHCPQLIQSESLRPGIVHRLDKDTTGLLLAAKDEVTRVVSWRRHSLLGKFIKSIMPFCLGNPGNRRIEGNIGRHQTRRQEMAVLAEGGKTALTLCETYAFENPLSYVKLIPYTGRTHQLRVHMKHVGFPILGDPMTAMEKRRTKNGK